MLVSVAHAVPPSIKSPPPCQPKERARNVIGSRGRWIKVQTQLKMEAHRIGDVVMDVAAFKVSHSVDIDATAVSHSVVGPTALRAARAMSSCSGAMEESSGKASTQKSQRCCHGYCSLQS